ncbi:MAG: LPS export ABC transporter periplasmic protein LptC [Candidatus Omnitrophica bacterium]|nr:LPS export ABC transporter periplasmic protein LptC [Candidatus Omnitrophota bacterium]
MVKRFIVFSVIVVVGYIGSVMFKLYEAAKHPAQKEVAVRAQEEPSHKVYSFSFSKYKTNGTKELVIDGDSADIFSKTVVLSNVIAKAYADEQPVTVTADNGTFDKASGRVHLRDNVVATTENGAKLITESLDIFPSQKTIATEDQAIVKKDNMNIKGDGASGDSQMKNVQFKKNVTVVVQSENNGKKIPTTITCDGPLDINYDKNIAHFYKNVVAEDERGKLTADEMEVFYNKETKKVAKIVATGNVIIRNPQGNETYSDNVVYFAEEGRIILGGDTEVLYLAGSLGGKENLTGTGFEEIANIGKTKKNKEEAF